jgi:glycosyltransferase involved in cell wall biosynthesis
MISLLIATWNGALTLGRTLEAMTRLEPPEAGHEIIVVDNASTDDTPRIIDGFRDRLPLIHLTEERRGKAHALNTAIETARGDFLVFTDDDVIPDPGWLRAYEEAAREHPDYGFFIGQIRHDWARPPPYWLERLGAAGMSYGGTPMDRPEGPVSWLAAKGANMAVRRDTLGNVRYRTEAGINYMGTGTGTGGVDSWFARDASEQRIWYAPDACLKHMVRMEEIGVRPVFRRYVRIGMTNYFIEADIQSLFARHVLGVPFPLTSRLVRSAIGGAYRLVRGDTEAAARRMLGFALDWGRMKSWRNTGKQ